MSNRLRAFFLITTVAWAGLDPTPARALDNYDIDFTIKITRITDLSPRNDFGGSGFDNFDGPDFFMRVTVDACLGQPTPCPVTQEGHIVDDTFDIIDYQSFTFQVPVKQRTVGVSLFLADHDGAILEGSDDVADISPIPNHTSHEFVVDMALLEPTRTIGGCTQGGPGSDDALVCWVLSAANQKDSDGDGLPDHYELHGHDFNGDGVIDADENLSAMGANPDRKDVFVEVDCMVSDGNGNGFSSTDPADHSHCPLPAAIQDVVQAFANAPVANADGTTGVQLHVDIGPLNGAGVVTPVTSAGGATGTYGDLRVGGQGGGTQIPEVTIIDYAGAGGATNFFTLKSSPNNFFERSPQRKQFFRYAIFGHQTNLRRSSNDCTSGQAEAVAAANDFYVTLGGTGPGGGACWGVDANGFSVGTRAQQAGTFMHELGHTLGLGHGGGDGTNNKPNYLSVMNYSFQACDATGVAVPAGAARQGVPASPDGTLPGGCDYSRVVLPQGAGQLDETSLDECAGIGGLGFGSVDWNASGVLQGTSCLPPTTNVTADINGDGVCVTAGPDNTLQTVAAAGDVNGGATILDSLDRVCQTTALAGSDDVQAAAVGAAGVQPRFLTGFNDWANLQYDFSTSSFAANGVTAPVPDEPDPDAIARAQLHLSTAMHPVVQISDTAPATILPGQTVTFTVELKNVGQGPALETRFVDTAPHSTPAAFDVGPFVVGASLVKNFYYRVPTDACPESLVNRAEASYRDLVGQPLTSTASAITKVLDIVPPTLTLSLSPTRLWPPNHKLVAITATITVTDNCDPHPTVRLVSITSNEPDNGLGDGDTAGDIQGANFGTDDRQFLVRAERSGLGTGRVYTVTYAAADASGNTTTKQATISVPKNP